MLENANYSIAILSYNHPELTAATVKSVLQLGFNPAQVNLVHNGSELKHQSILFSQFPEIKHLLLPENKGYSGGANFALDEIFKTAENILFLTNDTEALSLETYFPDHLDFFSIPILKRNSKNLDSLMGTVNLRTGKLAHIKSSEDLINLPAHCKSYIPGTAFGINKKTYVTIGKFDESLHTYWEDVDFSLRAHDSNLRVGSFDRFQVKHKIGKTCHKHRFYTLYLFQRNRKRILKKFGTSSLVFHFYFLSDMTRLFFKILYSKNFLIDFKFWWKAICD